MYENVNYCDQIWSERLAVYNATKYNIRMNDIVIKYICYFLVNN